MLNRWNPDKHLRIQNPRLKLALRMTWYCMVFSYIAGFLLTLLFLLDFAHPDLENIKQALVLATFFGGGTALFQRLLASILIGATMAFVSGKFFGTVNNPWAFKFVMGLIAGLIIHLFAPLQLVRFYLAELTGGEYAPYLESAGVIAVYAGAVYLSQVMAGKYIREIDEQAQAVTF